MTKRAALITGSSRGIGKGIALALASAGFDIAVNSSEDGEEIEGTQQIQRMAIARDLIRTGAST